jgi:hypothetical protein
LSGVLNFWWKSKDTYIILLANRKEFCLHFSAKLYPIHSELQTTFFPFPF